MTKLTAQPALGDQTEYSWPGCDFSEVVGGSLFSIAAKAGKEADAKKALKRAHKLVWPGPNKAKGAALWFDHQHIVLQDVLPKWDQLEFCYITDISDGWGAFVIQNINSIDVLKRLTPLDIRPASFPEGTAVRTQVGHMSAHLTNLGDNKFQIMVFRSMAQTLLHEVEVAAKSVAGQNLQ